MSDIAGKDSKQTKTTHENQQTQVPTEETQTNTSLGLFQSFTSASSPPKPNIKQIQQLQSTIGNHKVQRLISNRYPSGTARINRQGDGEPVTPSDDLNDENWVEINKRGIVDDETGANLRDKPVPEEEGSTVITNLPQNTRVIILRHNPTPQNWYAIRVIDGDFAGQSGYVADWLIRDDLPDPEAMIYSVKSGDMLGDLVQSHEQYSGYSIETGDDARSLVMAVYTANQGGQGVRLVGEADGGMLEGAADAVDEYRRVTREIYQTIELVSGEDIWLPSVTYVESLKASGIIPTRPDWMNATIEVGKGIGGFTAGIADGLISAVVDLIVGVFDLAKNVIDTIISVITGEALSAAQEMFEYFEALSQNPDQLRELAAGLVEALASAVVGSIDTFMSNWNAALIFDRWYFRGKIVGYILAEVAMAYLSGGASSLKWLDKLGDVGRFLKRVVSRVEGALDAVPDIPGLNNRRDRTPDVDVPNDRTPDVDVPNDRTPDGDHVDPAERLRVLTEARIIAETHDAANAPVPVVLASLSTLKRGNPWINEFYSVRKSEPGSYRILMRTEEDEVDSDYTTGTTDTINLDDLPERTRRRLQAVMDSRGLSIEDVTTLSNKLEGDTALVAPVVEQLDNLNVDEIGRFIDALPDRNQGTIFSEIREFKNRDMSVDEFISFRRANPIIPSNWNVFDPTKNEGFISKLREFTGQDNVSLTRDMNFAGGEGQLFFSPSQPNRALKRWFSNRLNDMDQSLGLLDDAARAIDDAPALSRHLEVVRVHERGPDWIIRDFDGDSARLKGLIDTEPMKTARNELLEELRGESGILGNIFGKLDGTPSDNLHWSYELGKILIIDMQ